MGLSYLQKILLANINVHRIFQQFILLCPKFKLQKNDLFTGLP